VDVRLESVPGAFIVRVINPNIPKLPFLGDGTAALELFDDVVDATTPASLERAARGVRAVGEFLTWGAPRGDDDVPLRYRGSKLDRFLSSKFVYGNGIIADVTNAEVVFISLAVGIGGTYAASYAYYVSLREEAEREAIEKKAKAAAAAAAAAAVAAGKKKEMKSKAGKTDDIGDDSTKAKEKVATTTTSTDTTTTMKATEILAVESVDENVAVAGKNEPDEWDIVARAQRAVVEVDVGVGAGDDDASRGGGADAPRRRKRDAIMKNLFGRGK
jgi:hypothetical protein